MSFNILHLSDIHLSFKTKQKNNDTVCGIANAIIEEVLKPNIIVVSGDVFDSSDFMSDSYVELIDQGVSF